MKRATLFLLTVLMLWAMPARAQTSITTTACPGAGCAYVTVENAGTLGLQLTGTFSGTVSWTYTNDDVTYYALTLYVPGSSTPVTSSTATGFWSGPVAGMKRVRVAFTSFTSGSAMFYTQTTVAVKPPASAGGSITGGTCTNQSVTALDTAGVPTCTTVTSAYVNNTIALTGTDVNTSNQVTATHLAAALPVTQGGTALATLTSHAIYVGNGTSAPTALAVCGTGSYVRGAAAADPVCSTLTLPNAATLGDIMVATGANAEGALADAATGNVVISGGVGAAPSYGKVTSAHVDNTVALTGTDINTSNQVTVTHLAAALPVAQGGTSLATLTAHAIYVGNGTSAPTALAVCGTGTYVRGAVTADPVCSTLTLPNAATQGDLMTATGANAVGSVAAVAAGQVLTSAGTSTVPAYSATPTLGVAASQAGTLALAKGVGGGALWTLASAATSNWTLTGAATAPAQGDLFTFSNATGQMASVADVAAGSYLRSGGTSTVPSYSTLTLPNTAATGSYLIATGTNVVTAVTPAWTATIAPADQTGNATATFKMNGLGAAASPCTITPVATGRVKFTIYGILNQNTTADGVTWKLAFGTGTAPANAAALTGTILGPTGVWTALTGMLAVPFVIEGTTTGLALSTAVWFDLQVADVTGGTASITKVGCLAVEG